MAYLLDSGFLYATIDEQDNDHKRVVELFPTLAREQVILPTIVLVEVTYLLLSRRGHKKMKLFIDMLYKSPFKFVCISKQDTQRISQLLDKYSDLELDFVDASITALAERLNIKEILTVDQRDFRVIRPLHCEYFEIWP